MDAKYNSLRQLFVCHEVRMAEFQYAEKGAGDGGDGGAMHPELHKHTKRMSAQEKNHLSL